MKESKQNNTTNLANKEYVTAELTDYRIIGKLKQSFDGPESSLLRERGLLLVGPYWISPLSGGQFTRCDEEMFIKSTQITAWHTHEDLIADSFEFFL